MSRSCLTVMKNAYNSLSKTDKKIADYIFENADKVPNMAVAELASIVQVAPSSIVRFCKKVGYEGFYQLKLAITAATQVEKDIILPAVSLTDSNKQVFEKVFQSSITTIKDTLKMIDIEKIDSAIDAMATAKSINFYGVGTSATIAMDAYYRFMRIGFPAFYSTDNHIMRISASTLKNNDVAIGISHCGSTIDTVETLKIAKEKGATTICITSNSNGEICKYSDIAIVVYSDEIRYPMEAVSARIAHIAILDSFCVALSLKNYDRTIKYVNQMNDLFRAMRK